MGVDMYMCGRLLELGRPANRSGHAYVFTGARRYIISSVDMSWLALL